MFHGVESIAWADAAPASRREQAAATGLDGKRSTCDAPHMDATIARRHGMARGRFLVALVSVGLVSACQPSGKGTDGSGTRTTPDPAASDSEAVRTVVRQIGERLQRVSLLAPRSDLVAAIRSEYGALVAPTLLEKWAGDPTSAPGRLTSSPWPDHIEIENMVRGPDAEYTVTGEVVERTSADAAGSAANSVPVRLTVARVDDRWLIAKYVEDRSPPSGAPGPDEDAGAANVVRTYYRAIDERRYRDAYQLWESNGAASGKSFDEFRSGFSETATVEATLETPGRLGAAAGSRYLEVPVRVVARLRNGATQEFTGTYTLRRSLVDGATREQRAWHIYSGKLRQVK